MNIDIEKILKSQSDSNFKMFYKNYKENILSEESCYNLLFKNYTKNFKEIKQLKKILNYNKNIDEIKKISIIIPTYNRKNQLKECIDSILEQTYTNFEILIIDDCSTDGTQEFIKENYSDNRIIYIKNEKNSGAGYSRSNGYKKSTGDYIIFCDDDDYYIDNNYFSKAVKVLKNEEISLVVSNSYVHFEKENRYVLNKINFDNMIPVEKFLEKFQFEYMKPNSTFTTIFKKQILEKADFCEMKMVNDCSIYLRGLISGGRVYVNENIIGIYRIHSKNITFNIKADFLIDNLNEKKYIYQKIKEKKLSFDPKFWFEKQIILTVEYFFSGTNPIKSEKNKIYKWIKNNVNFKSNIFFKLKIFEYKVIIKKIIKKAIGRK